MRHSKDDFIRIPFVVMRSNKKVREWFRGAMLYVHRNPSWYLRIFEIDGRASKGARVLDFGNQEPDSRHLVCGVRWLLVHSDKPIADITSLAGFRSQSRLKALFQKQFGTSMSDYRKRALPTHYEVTFTIPVIFGIIVAS